MSPTNWTGRTIPTTSWGARTDLGFLLMETGDFLLLETGDKFLLEESYSINTSWNGRIIP